MSIIDSPPDPDMSDLDICADCHGPIFTAEWSATGCDCRDFCDGGCEELVSRDVLAPLTLPSGKVVQACPGCRGVPEAVEAESSGAQTVRLEKEPTGELAAKWFEKLDATAWGGEART